MKATNHPSDKMTIKNNNGDLLLEIDAEGVEEIKFKNGSKYTGAEIDAAVAKAEDATKVTANPTLAGTEAALTGLEVGETKYKVEQPINVVANPTLAGTEAALEGLQVGDTKYKVGGSRVFDTWSGSVTMSGSTISFKGTKTIAEADKNQYKLDMVDAFINGKDIIEFNVVSSDIAVLIPIGTKFLMNESTVRINSENDQFVVALIFDSAGTIVSAEFVYDTPDEISATFVMEL